MHLATIPAYQHAANLTTQTSGTLLLLRKIQSRQRVPTEALQHSVSMLGAAMRELDRTTPVICPHFPKPLPPAPPAPPKPTPVSTGTVVRRFRDQALTQQTVSGCKALLLEIIRRAAYDWVLYRESIRLHLKKLAEEAYTWLFEERVGHPYWIERVAQRKDITSFLAICELLDLDPTMVRRHIRLLTTKHVMNVGRPAEYRRLNHNRLEEATVSTADIEEPQFESFESLEEEGFGRQFA